MKFEKKISKYNGLRGRIVCMIEVIFKVENVAIVFGPDIQNGQTQLFTRFANFAVMKQPSFPSPVFRGSGIK